jgi:hypothetical protein
MRLHRTFRPSHLPILEQQAIQQYRNLSFAENAGLIQGKIMQFSLVYESLTIKANVARVIAFISL